MRYLRYVISTILIVASMTQATQLGDINSTTEMEEFCQDAIGAMIDASLTYVDATPLLQRAALTGDCTASAGSNATTIPNNTVTYAKMQDVSLASKLLGRGDSGAGDPQEITLGAGLTMTGTTLSSSGGVSDGDKGDITVSGGGATWTIDNDVVTYAKMQDVTDARVLGRAAGTSGDTQELTAGSGISISSGAIASTITQYTDELAQDAVGAMVDVSLVYVDATPLLTRAALTGDVTAAQGSNATTIANDAVTDAKLRNSGATSVIGRSANSTGDPADITTSTDGQVLRRAGAVLGFGAVDLADSDAVTGTLPSGNLPTSVVLDTDANTYTAGQKQSFTHSGTTAGLRLVGAAGDPSGLSDGDMWYDSTAGKFRCREGATSKDCIGTGGSGAPTNAQYITLATDATLTAERVITPGTGVDLTDGGAGGNLTVDIDISEFSTVTPAIDDSISFADTSAGAPINGKATVESLFITMMKEARRGVFFFYTDFPQETNTTANDGTLTETNSGTGAATTTQAGDAGRPGIARATTGTTATGRTALMSAVAAIRFGGGEWFFEAIVNVTTLSTAGERFQFPLGFIDNTGGPNVVDGAYFLYDEGGVSTGSAASANWQTVTASNSTRTFTTTSTAVTAGQWYRLRIVVNADATSVDFSIDGVDTGTNHTTNIPTAAGRETGFGYLLIKSVGTTARTIDYDYLNVVGDLTTVR